VTALWIASKHEEMWRRELSMRDLLEVSDSA
jgi:hypothetical protein